MVAGDFLNLWVECCVKLRRPFHSFYKHLSDGDYVIYVGPPARARLFEQPEHVTIPMHSCQNRLATTKVIVELRSYVDSVVRD